MRYVLASNNKGKLREMRKVLAGTDVELVSQSEAGAHFEAEETGETFAENALIKARAACVALHEPAIADDSGLCVEALGGAPGVYSARYGGCSSDEERLALLLKNLGGEENRGAKFVCCIACVFPNGDTLTACGECAGRITVSPRGAGGFGYDPVFELPELGKTMAELSEEEKNAVSHRGRALKAFQEKLRDYNAHK